MSWWFALYIALSISLFVGLFIIGDDEPFTVRVLTALVVALFWLAGLILLVIVMLIDMIADLWRTLRP